MTAPAAPAPPGAAWVARAALAVLAHPGLWATALVQLRRLAAPGWWRRTPFLPLPDPAYLRFRLQTMYGGDEPPEPDIDDLITFLHWCKAHRALT